MNAPGCFPRTLLFVALTMGCKSPEAHRPPPPAPAAAVSLGPTPAGPSESSAAIESAPNPPWPPRPAAPPIPDTGIYPDLDARVELRAPDWLSGGPWLVVEGASPKVRLFLIDGVAVGFAPESAGPAIQLANNALGDLDADGIPDALDILIGAKKTVLNGAHYKSTYRVIPFPGGDMPRAEGVCTDVVVRALRNAGIDLQKEISADRAARPQAFPGIQRPDKNIDHRRVRNLLPYFKRAWQSLPIDPHDPSSLWLPGDVVFLDTMNDPQPEHMGIVSDRRARSGLPLIVNNWTDGTTTAEMDLLSFVPVRYRFRITSKAPVLPPEHRGVEALLARRGLAIPPEHHQLLLVTSPLWTTAGGELRRFAREAASDLWQPIGSPVPVQLGAKGMGIGRGIAKGGTPQFPGLAPKREGDQRSPAGAFALGTAFGPAPAAPYVPGAWPWRMATGTDRWVDDPQSPNYNTWQREGERTWKSAEDLSTYALAVVVEHNTAPVVPGAGSAIFLHTWSNPPSATVGCTAMAKEELVRVLGWLDPKAHPLLVQVAGHVY